MPDAIFIAGYYRSGTSALAGALQLLGVSLHNDAEANEHNPLGFFEIPELIELDVDIFAHLGIEWSDLRGLPAGWQAYPGMARFLARLEEILRRRFGAEPLWAIKHPHLCRLLPLYERAARQAGHTPHVINITRDPWMIADSQFRKNGLTRAHSLLLWLGYLISCEQHSRHLPRSWITYQDLLADPAAQIRQIEHDLGIPLAQRVPDGLRQACAFPAARLNRSDISPQDGLYPPLRRFTGQVWDAISSRDFAAATWDGFARTCGELIGFLGEIGGSQAVAIAGFSRPRAAPSRLAGAAALRPPERLDDGAKQRLLTLAAAPALPKLHILIAAPPNRAHAIGVTLESLRAQWHAADEITIITADPFETAGHRTFAAPAQAGALTAMICAQLNEKAAAADYVAVLNAGDTLQPDACLRFAIAVARSGADMIYCDEIVEGENAAWVRHKPVWDITRLRQAAYIGDWVWYRSETLTRLGGFNPARAGAEEYDVQLRLAEIDARVERLPEALFTRAHLSRRDNISSPVFGARAVDAITDHFSRLGIAGTVRPRTHLGLFQHLRAMPDPGTSVILLCEGADMSMLDWWTHDLVASRALTGTLILAGTESDPETGGYLTRVADHEAALNGRVRAVRPAPGLPPAASLAQALAMVTTEFTAIIDARSRPLTPGWGQALLNRLADPGVAMAAARLLVPEGEPVRFAVRGPIIPGAEDRLGATHCADDPGTGGWLAVDQEAGAVAPAALIARTRALAACDLSKPVSGDAFWAAICAQIRDAGQRIVWTPDVSFLSMPDTIEVNAQGFDGGAPFHHPALALRGDLLAPEARTGLVRAAPFDPQSLLITGPADTGFSLLNAARALRGIGAMEASWAPEPLTNAEILRRAPSSWVRINPARAASHPHIAVFTESAGPENRAAIHGAARLFATSPALAVQLRKFIAPGQAVTLWRPALSRAVWHDVNLVTGLNTSPRILWIDEGFAPPWLPELINQTSASATWIVVEHPGAHYAGATLRMKAPEDEQGWARDLCGLAPHIFLRPAHWQAAADQYPALLAAAAGCAGLVDDRLDIPAALGAQRLPNNFFSWQSALAAAIADLPVTLERGAQARAAALALPAIEDCRPTWADFGIADMPLRSAAE
jgi:hypothetical protein